jgi:hypothetical protein
MSYFRAPTAVRAGRALKQSIPPDPTAPAGNVDFEIDADIATTTDLGVVKVGTGLTVAADGTLSANGGGGNHNCVTRYVNADYTVQSDDYYIGVVKPSVGKTVDIKLPVIGAICRILIIKDQRGPGGYKTKIIPQGGNDLEGRDQELELQQPYESVTLLGQNGAWWVIANVQQS